MIVSTTHLPRELVLEQRDVMTDVYTVRAQQIVQALINLSITPHEHVLLHQEASVKEHHMSEQVIIADTCHLTTLVVEAAGIVRDGDDRFVQILRISTDRSVWPPRASPSPPA
jgi:hypothetical protein